MKAICQKGKFYEQIQINKWGLKTSICGILIDKPNKNEIYELESVYIKDAFAQALEKRDLIRVANN